MASFPVQKLLCLIRSPFSLSAFVAIAFGIFMIKSFPVLMFRMALPRLSSRDFIILGCTFKILIHLEVIFVYDVRRGSSFNLLYVTSYFCQHHLLNKESFPPCSFFVRSDDQIAVGGQSYFWVLYSVPLAYVSVFVPVP